jgi:hypothetical protein
LAVAAAVVAACSSLAAASAPMGRAAPVPRSKCKVFPANNVWNMDISRLPVNKLNATWKRSMHASTTKLHPDFGPPSYGIPFNVVGASQPTVHVAFNYASESDHVAYPFGPGTKIEGGSDRHALMINKSTCRLFELYAANWNGGHPTAGSGATWSLGSNRFRPRGWTSADAAGLPIFPGLVRLDEVKAGAIDHAIRFTVNCTRNRFIWPARHQAGVSNAHCPPMGARFRLRASFSEAGYGKGARVIIEAMKHYGLIVADNGSDWYFQGSVDRGWTYSLVDQLKKIPAGAFVAVDESKCIVAPASAAFAYGPGCPGP